MKLFDTAFIIFLHPILLSGHGFSADTFIVLANKKLQHISTVCYRAKKKEIAVASYDTMSSYQRNSKAVHGGRSTSSCFVRLGFDERLKNSKRHEVACTPTQEFYSATTHQWVPAYQLKVGNELLCAHNTTKTVAYIELVKKPLDIFTIEVKHTHTFFVTQHALLTHNMVIPAAFSVGLSIPFGASAGGTAGGFFGPITFLVGAAIGCAVGALVKIACNSKISTYTVDTYDVNTFEQYVNQQPQVATFSESQITANSDYVAKQYNVQSESQDTCYQHVYYDENNDPLFSTAILNLPKEKLGCGNTTPEKPLILITPAEPMPVFQDPGYRPLSDEERKLLSGGCTIIPIPAQEKADFTMIMTAEDAQKRWTESEKMQEFMKQFNELAKNVDKTKPKSYLSYSSSKQIEKALLDGDKLWQEIRQNNNDIERISNHTGFSKEAIKIIKEHVFYREHIKNMGIGPFDADYDMAKAWERLSNNSFVYADLELLRHELAETLLMGEKNMSYDDAHKIVDNFFSWVNQLEGY